MGISTRQKFARASDAALQQNLVTDTLVANIEEFLNTEAISERGAVAWPSASTTVGAGTE